MGNCPICGNVIPANLVKAILDPNQPEQCPQRGRGEPKQKRLPLGLNDFDPDDVGSYDQLDAYLAYALSQSVDYYGAITKEDFVLAHG